MRDIPVIPVHCCQMNIQTGVGKTAFDDIARARRARPVWTRTTTVSYQCARFSDYSIPPRVLTRFGYTMAPMVALHHAGTPLVSLCRSGACAATALRCHKYRGICDTDLGVFRVHQDARYVLESLPVSAVR